MELYQSDEGPANDPCHAVEHLLYDVVVQGLPEKESGGDSCEKLACFCLKTMKITYEFLFFYQKPP